MTKRLSLIVIACVALALLILPASAAVNQIAQGNDVFIGELGINITDCVGGATQLAWFAAGSSPATDVPNYVKSVGNAANFYVAPSDFVGRTGNWYQWTGASPAGAAAFNVLDPSIDIKVWDQKTVKDVSGKSVPAGDFLNFRIESNLYTIAQRPTYDPATNGQFTIKVKTADGFVYNALFQSTSTSISLLKVSVSQQPAYWVNPNNVNSIGWNTGVLDTQGARMYKAGVYTCTVECNVNGIKDNYVAPDGSAYTGKTVSAARTVTIATDTVKVEASKDSVVKGNPFSVTITGKPSTPYYMWVKGTGQMSGDVNDRPPFIIPDQEGLTQDNVNGPYTIGSYVYQGGAGNTIKDDVPDKPSNGTIYYGLVTLKDTGTRTIGWQTTQETKDKKYTIRVELRSGVAPNYEYKSDEVDVKVEKGTVTVVAAGDQSYYLGQEVKLSGTNSETDTVYMFITGPNLPSVGGTLIDPRARVIDGDPFSFTTASVLDDNTWEYKWQTSNLNIDAGTYTVYAVATPNDRDNLGNTQYSTVSIIVKKPFVSAVASQSTVAAGDKFYIRGVAQGQPSVGIAIWTLGKNYAKYDTTTVPSNRNTLRERLQVWQAASTSSWSSTRCTTTSSMYIHQDKSPATERQYTH
jgi:trimeric autotransporter adhesin